MGHNTRVHQTSEVPVEIEVTESYVQLRADVSAVLSRGQEQARKMVEQVRVQTYWDVGAHLNVFLDGIDRSYGDQTLQRLATDVGVDRSRLYEMLEFHRRIEKIHSSGQLSWSHFRHLIRIADASVRIQYLKAAEANSWSVRQLEEQIADSALAALPESKQTPVPGEPRLVAKRGEPWIYRLIDKPGAGRALDLGFRVFEQMADHEDRGLEIGTLVRAQKKAGRYHFVPYQGRRQTFSYRATVASIIDADTFRERNRVKELMDSDNQRLKLLGGRGHEHKPLSPPSSGATGVCFQ